MAITLHQNRLESCSSPLKYAQKASIIECIKTEQSTVNDLKRFCPGLHNMIIQEFIKIKFVTFNAPNA